MKKRTKKKVKTSYKWLIYLVGILLIVSWVKEKTPILFDGAEEGQILDVEQSGDFVDEGESYTGGAETEQEGSSEVSEYDDASSPLIRENYNLEGTWIDLSEKDSLGRCRVATALLGPDTLPLEERESIGMIKPSGWHTVHLSEDYMTAHPEVDSFYLYNRCHMIAHSLSGLNADDRNLITGTRWLNVEYMLPYEMKVLSYIRETGNRVLYRVTPIYEGDNLVASEVRMEALSIENNEISFDVYLVNEQPGVYIDYKTGEASELW